jgi:hypothetical protein
MRNRSTVEFLGLWERIHNQDFNYLEFEVIDRDAGRNAFVLTPKHGIESVNAVGMTSKQDDTLRHTPTKISRSSSRLGFQQSLSYTSSRTISGSKPTSTVVYRLTGMSNGSLRKFSHFVHLYSKRALDFQR